MSSDPTLGELSPGDVFLQYGIRFRVLPGPTVTSSFNGREVRPVEYLDHCGDEDYPIRPGDKGLAPVSDLVRRVPTFASTDLSDLGEEPQS